jgi:hypothetical protein
VRNPVFFKIAHRWREAITWYCITRKRRSLNVTKNYGPETFVATRRPDVAPRTCVTDIFYGVFLSFRRKRPSSTPIQDTQQDSACTARRQQPRLLSASFRSELDHLSKDKRAPTGPRLAPTFLGPAKEASSSSSKSRETAAKLQPKRLQVLLHFDEEAACYGSNLNKRGGVVLGTDCRLCPHREPDDGQPPNVFGQVGFASGGARS